ncbi:hypothetical protein ABC733_18965 [Mangrovibacter sp. SLW1]
MNNNNEYLMEFKLFLSQLNTVSPTEQLIAIETKGYELVSAAMRKLDEIKNNSDVVEPNEYLINEMAQRIVMEEPTRVGAIFTECSTLSQAAHLNRLQCEGYRLLNIKTIQLSPGITKVVLYHAPSDLTPDVMQEKAIELARTELTKKYERKLAQFENFKAQVVELKTAVLKEYNRVSRMGLKGLLENVMS